MCDTAACDREPVVFVDIAFPAGATIDDRPLPAQRLGFCLRHAVDAELHDGPLMTGRAVKGMRANGRFPDGHVCAADWSWTVN